MANRFPKSRKSQNWQPSKIIPSHFLSLFIKNGILLVGCSQWMKVKLITVWKIFFAHRKWRPKNIIRFCNVQGFRITNVQLAKGVRLISVVCRSKWWVRWRRSRNNTEVGRWVRSVVFNHKEYRKKLLHLISMMKSNETHCLTSPWTGRFGK